MINLLATVNRFLDSYNRNYVRETEKQNPPQLRRAEVLKYSNKYLGRDGGKAVMWSQGSYLRGPFLDKPYFVPGSKGCGEPCRTGEVLQDFPQLGNCAKHDHNTLPVCDNNLEVDCNCISKLREACRVPCGAPQSCQTLAQGKSSKSPCAPIAKLFWGSHHCLPLTPPVNSTGNSTGFSGWNSAPDWEPVYQG